MCKDFNGSLYNDFDQGWSLVDEIKDNWIDNKAENTIILIIITGVHFKQRAPVLIVTLN